MDIDVPSQREFDDLKNRFDSLLKFLGIEEVRCPESPQGDVWHRYQACSVCGGEGTIFVKKGDK
ncbi:MAG: hypothetical protein IT371_30400 [Deltaproteobacteria bacterium]|nr:hypothetical protein [Deltaproteobacteria bacterium]